MMSYESMFKWFEPLLDLIVWMEFIQIENSLLKQMKNFVWSMSSLWSHCNHIENHSHFPDTEK